MKTSRKINCIGWNIGLLALITIFVVPGCATKKYVGEQVIPVADRVSKTETRLGQAENRLGQTEGQIGMMDKRLTINEGKISGIESNLIKTDAKAEKALSALGSLKFERRMVIDMKKGANFGFNSSNLTDTAKKEIDTFLGDVPGSENAVFLVAGHTDNAGDEDINYELGKRRADMVSRYLVTEKKIDPLRVVTVSYGEGATIADNNTRDGRALNRRVEIIVYSEVISSK